MIHSTAEYLKLIAEDTEPAWHRLQWEAATPEVWSEILRYYPEYKRVVSANKLLEPAVMRILAKDKDPLVRSDIASKNSLPDDLFYLLANDKDENVRSKIVFNKNAPIELLHQLKKDKSELVAQAVKNRLSAPRLTGKIVNPLPKGKVVGNLKPAAPSVPAAAAAPAVRRSGTFTPQPARLS